MLHSLATHCRQLAAAVLLAAISQLAWAGDRPFLATHSAAAEEDDDAVWSVESWFQRVGALGTWSFAPEYSFDPTTSVQFEFARTRDRDAASTEQEAEIEFKHLFNHIARDGYGWGIVTSLGFGKGPAQGWRYDSVAVKLPFTLALWEGDGALHLNAGLRKARDARRETLLSAAVERQVFRRATLFAEVAREGDATLLHGGLRWWLKKERFALDVSALRTRSPGSRDSGWVLGLGWYDL